MSDPSIERLRRLCLALPEVTERLSYGEPTWFVRDKTSFVTTADHHHDDRVAFWCAAPDGAQEDLVASAPERFFRRMSAIVAGSVSGWTCHRTGTRSRPWSKAPIAGLRRRGSLRRSTTGGQSPTDEPSRSE